jgi:N-acyl-D-amino-acid deacylase
MSFELVIKNGKIVDGTGNPWFRADIGIKDGLITEIGRITGSSGQIIDAD